MTGTLTDICNQTMALDPFPTDNTGKGRLWIHDVLHGILDLPPVSARNEMEVAIYQAVLMRTNTVTTRNVPFQDGGEEVLLADIHERIVPGVKDFLQRLADARGHKVRYLLTHDEIRSVYEKACILNGLVKRELGCYLGEIPIDMLKAMPTERMTNIIQQCDSLWWNACAEEQYDGLNKYL